MSWWFLQRAERGKRFVCIVSNPLPIILLLLPLVLSLVGILKNWWK